jgi:hypothetical protein
VHANRFSAGIEQVTDDVLFGPRPLRYPDVLATRTLWTLSTLECDGLSFAKLVEGDLRTGRIVKKVLGSITGQNETEPFVADKTFDSAAQSCHGLSFARVGYDLFMTPIEMFAIFHGC